MSALSKCVYWITAGTTVYLLKEMPPTHSVMPLVTEYHVMYMESERMEPPVSQGTLNETAYFELPFNDKGMILLAVPRKHLLRRTTGGKWK